MQRNPEWPAEFLGRCSHCLDNAYLDAPGRCWDRFTASYVPDHDCLVQRNRKAMQELYRVNEQTK